VAEAAKNFFRDVRFAARALRRQPGLAAAAILTLALGIGVNAGVFSLIDFRLLTPPPFRDPQSLVVAWGSNPEAARSMGVPDRLAVSASDFYDVARASRSLAHLSFFLRSTLNLAGAGDPEQLLAYRVTGDFFNLLGAPAALGRTLGPADDTPDQPAAVVLSHAFWQRRFGGDPRVLGRTISLSGLPMTVVGVMPSRFKFPGNSDLSPGDVQGPDVWMPTALNIKDRQNRVSRNVWVLGRLRPGVPLAAAQAELDTICRRLEKDHPGEDAGWGLRLAPLSQAMVAGLRPALLLLWAAVGLILLLACANVANLLLARAASRQREIAVRTAIGASRGRLLTQLLTESLVLALPGSGLGLALGKAGLAGFAALVPAGTIGIDPLALNLRVLAFSVLLCLLTTFLAGLAPALSATRPELAAVLRGGSREGAGRTGRRTRSALVVVEVALASLLLIGAGLLLRSFLHLLVVDPGFPAPGAIALSIDLPRNRYPEPRRRLFADRVLDRLRALPGVVAAGAASDLPLSGGNFYTFLIEGRPLPKMDQMPVAGELRATPGYFEALGLPLLTGRTFTASDAPGTPLAAVIDSVMAKTYWPGENPLGKRFRLGLPSDKDDPWYTVIGVVGSVRNPFESAPRPQMYRAASQHPSLRLAFIVRTTGKPRALLAAARAAVREVDPEQPIAREDTLEDIVDATLAGRRFSLFLLGLFAALALLLSGIGIYGVTAYSVAQRTKEMGLRLALGAQRGELLRLVVGEVGALAGLGLLVGLGAAAALTRSMSALLYGVTPADPATFLAVAIVLTGIALAAAYLPGRRATKVEPIEALREE
jgi:putative ABC transport system permease protein